MPSLLSPASRPGGKPSPGHRARARRARAKATPILPFERIPSAAVAIPSRPSSRSLILGYLLNPGSLIQQQAKEAGWPVVFAVSGSAFAMFFLQVGLDRLDAGTAVTTTVFTLTLLGVTFGTLGVTAVALVGWLGLRLFGAKEKPGTMVRTFALAYSPTLVYAALGLLANLLLGWRTAVAFGVTGVLWSLGPLLAALRQMMGGRVGASIALATVCGLLVLLGWAWLGGVI